MERNTTKQINSTLFVLYEALKKKSPSPKTHSTIQTITYRLIAQSNLNLSFAKYHQSGNNSHVPYIIM